MHCTCGRRGELRRIWPWLAVLACTWLRPSEGRAQPDAPPGDLPAVVAPRLVTESSASYPEQALRDHVAAVVTVVVLLEIDPNGHVGRTTVENPQGHGFDEAALEA